MTARAGLSHFTDGKSEAQRGEVTQRPTANHGGAKIRTQVSLTLEHEHALPLAVKRTRCPHTLPPAPYQHRFLPISLSFAALIGVSSHLEVDIICSSLITSQAWRLSCSGAFALFPGVETTCGPEPAPAF